MTDIHVTKYDETYIHIECDRSVAASINEYFTFTADNYRFDPRFKNKVWDGKIRIFKQLPSLLYKGLYDDLVEFARENGYTISSHYKQKDNPVTREEIEKIYSRNNSTFKPYPHQIEALYWSLKLQNALILSATSSGKSFFIYNLALTLKSIGPVLIIVPTVNLVEQLRKDFIDYSEFNQFDVGKNVHTIYAGMSKHEQVPITISTWQSIYEMPKQWFKQFKAVIGDECHLYKAKSLKTIMENLSNATFRIGTTGSLDNSETNKLVLKGLFGPIKQVVQTSEMIESGQATPMKIKILVMHYTEADKAVLKADYRQQTEWFATNEKRNKFIRKLVASQEGNKLVLFNLVDKHGIPLYKAFKKEYPDKDIFYISGKTPVAEREEIRKKLDEIEVGIHLTFGKKIVVCQRNTEVPLTNGTYKKASEITKNDDVLDSWIEKESKKHK